MLRMFRASVVMTLLLLSGVLLLGLVSFRSLPVISQADPAVGDSSRNGDVDGDGSINISDAVYLLDWLFRGGTAPVALAAGNGCCSEFDDLFTMPREPATALSPGQDFELEIPEGARILITDVYAENLGVGDSTLEILEQMGRNSFELRYRFRVRGQETTSIHFTSGLKLGDLAPIQGKILIRNSDGSAANILPRVNGVLVR